MSSEMLAEFTTQGITLSLEDVQYIMDFTPPYERLNSIAKYNEIINASTLSITLNAKMTRKIIELYYWMNIVECNMSFSLSMMLLLHVFLAPIDVKNLFENVESLESSNTRGWR